MKRIKHFIKKELSKNNKLMRYGMVIFSASAIANLMNYLFHVYMARTLGPADYGTLDSLISLLTILLFPTGIMQTVMIQFVSQYKAGKEYGKIRALILKNMKIFFIFGLLMAILGIAASSFFAGWLKTDRALIAIVFVIAFFSFFFPIIQGALNGLQKFVWYSASNILNTFLKLGFGVLLVYLGFRVAGALAAIGISAVITLVILFFPLSFLKEYKKQKFNHLDVWRYAIPVSIATLAMLSLTNIDVLLAKHYLSALDAGYYAAASTLAKIIWFATGTLVYVMFPITSELHANGKCSSSLLKSSLFYTAAIAFMGVIVYFTAPRAIVNILFGGNYPISGVIGLFSVAIAIFSINQVFIMYDLAVKRTRIVYALMVLAVLHIIGIVLFHSSIIDFVKVSVIVNAFLFIFLLFYHRDVLLSPLKR